MKIFHMIIEKSTPGGEKIRKEYKSPRQGSAPQGWRCVGVCGYHEERRTPKND